MKEATNMSQTSRDEIRKKIFAAKADSYPVTFNGAVIELRSPSLGSVFDTQATEDRKEAIAHMLIQFAYIPGTNEKVFEEADVDGIIALPFNSDMRKINDAIGKMTGAEVTEDTKSPPQKEQPEVDGPDGGDGVQDGPAPDETVVPT